MAPKRGLGTADRILDVAERLVQTRGFNAFSYADVAKTVGVQKASLHHHYPTKEHLGVALVSRYHRGFLEALAAIASDTDDAVGRLERYVEVYGAVLRRKRMCLCGMLAADVATLPNAMRTSLAEFFEANERWLSKVLEEGRTAGDLRFDGPAAATAAFFVSSLEGAMLVARGSGSSDHFARVARRLLESVRPVAPRKTKTKRSR